MIPITALPHVNALLNGASTFFLVLGFWYIRRKRIAQHRFCMLCALAASLLFLASYLVYHYQVGSKSFQGQGFIRPVYFAILLTHTILAMVNVPLVLITLREKFDQHARLARRWTLPVWLYVSVTGVLVYVMLYHL